MKALPRTVLAFFLLAIAAFVPAMAQDQPVVGTLHVVDGTVMTSSGGDFETATQDMPLHVGDRVMLSDEAKATFTYNNGVILHYESAGVYTVAMAPAKADEDTTDVASAHGSSVGSVATILGAALIAGVALDNMNDVKADRPVSH